MKKLLLSSIGLSVLMWAEISPQEAAQLEIRAAKIRQELGIPTPTAKQKRLEQIRRELKLDFDTSSKEALFGTNKPDTVASLIASEDKSMTESILSEVERVGEKLGLSSSSKKGSSYSFGSTLNSFYKTVGLEEGENWGMPSLFGFNEKKKKKRSLFGIGILGDIQDTGNTIFKGMKYSGQSAEFTSGMIYKSSKMYNTMFGMFEESPFNLFEEEEESSVFDLLEGGNKVLDFFD